MENWVLRAKFFVYISDIDKSRNSENNNISMAVFNVLKINVHLKIKSQINFERRRYDSNNPIRSFYVSIYPIDDAL